MSDRLCLYCTMIQHVRRNLPQEHMARLKTLAWMVTGVILAETVNLDSWVALVARPDGLVRKAASVRRRFARFLDNTRHVDPQRLYRPFIQTALSAWAGRTVYLALDTSTIAGRLMMVRVSLIYRGRAVPVMWKVLNQTSAMVSLEQYHDLLQRASDLLPPGAVPVLLGDRGFRDSHLMAALKALGWSFRLGVVKSEEVEFSDGRVCKLEDIRLAQGQVRFFQRLWLTEARYGPVNLALGWSAGPQHEVWYIVTPDSAGWDTLREYGLRMDIEAGFRDEKSGGFPLEDSRLEQAEALERLLLVLALAALHLVATGTEVVAHGRRPVVDPHWHRALSYLQIGWRYLRHCLAHRLPLGLSAPLDCQPDPQPVLPKHPPVFTQVVADVPICA